ncbi:MAG: sigma-70 family RNA polymerase sigma factor [Pseudomonadota bacterium]|nr:sigma-70 family RNA polymerase sigma factor [Pseudomonadota bacterium]
MNDSPRQPPNLTNVPNERGELAAIVRAIAAGDRPAMALLYQRTSAKLFGICLRLLGSEAEAEDVLQDVYVTVWRKAAMFDSAKASAITWLSVLARNRSIDRLRQRRAKLTDLDQALDVADGDPSAFDLAVQAQDRDRLTNCLDELDDRPRTMIRAAFVDGSTYSELATREAVPLGTMKSWIRRALHNLRQCLER